MTFFESLKVVLKNMVDILMMPAKLTTLDLLKTKVFLKGYDVTNSNHDVTNKILSREKLGFSKGALCSISIICDWQ